MRLTDKQQAALYFARKRRRERARGTTVEPRIVLTGNTVSEDASSGTTVGVFSVVNGSGTYAFTLTGDAGGLFALDSEDDTELETAGALNYEAATSHSITVQADNGVDPVLEQTFNIVVINVLEITLVALSLDTDEIEEGSPENTPVGTLQDVTSGSGLSLTDDAGGRFKLSGSDIVAGATPTDYGTATSHNITVRETHPDGSNSPRNSVISISVTQASAGVPVNTVAPVISGNVQVGQELSCTTGTWTNSPSSYAYQWKRQGVDISGATASTYTLVEADAGIAGPITCEVTATNGAGDSDPATSNTLVIDVYVVFLDSIEDSANATTYSGGVWDGISFGVAAANRKLVMGVGARGSSPNEPFVVPASTTIGGDAVTEALAFADPGVSLGDIINQGGFYVVDKPTGTSGNISITLAAASLRCGAGLWAMYGADSSIPFAAATTFADNTAVPLQVPPGASVIGYAFANAATAAWDVLSANFDGAVESTINHTGASLNSSAGGTLTPKVDFTTVSSADFIIGYAVWYHSTPAVERVAMRNVVRTWFNSPSTLQVGGRLILSGVGESGGLFIGYMGGPVRQVPGYIISTDDHGNAGFLRRSSDNRILAAFTDHNDGEYGIAIQALGNSSLFFDVANVDSSLGAENYSYANLVEITDGIFNIFRCDASPNWRPHYSVSTDNGATWAAVVELIGGSRPYVHVIKNGANRFDVVCTTGHPNETTNSLYHFYYDGGDWFDSDGNDIGDPSFTPASDFTAIYGAGNCWGHDLQAYSGTPVVVFATFPTPASDHRYRYGKWNGSSWDTYEICTAGGPLYAAETYYSGGICLDPDDENVIYCSRETDGVYQIWRGVTADGGQNWTMTQLTSGMVDCFRPQKAAGSDYVTYVRGTYTSYTSYDTDIIARYVG
jgi:hypothetical protein